MIWTQARAAWERRRQEKNVITPDMILNATAAWLNGDEKHALDEGLWVQSAVLNDTTIVVTYMPTDEGKVPFRASFKLCAIETQEFAKARRSQREQ